MSRLLFGLLRWWLWWSSQLHNLQHAIIIVVTRRRIEHVSHSANYCRQHCVCVCLAKMLSQENGGPRRDRSTRRTWSFEWWNCCERMCSVDRSPHRYVYISSQPPSPFAVCHIAHKRHSYICWTRYVTIRSLRWRLEDALRFHERTRDNIAMHYFD